MSSRFQFSALFMLVLLIAMMACSLPGAGPSVSGPAALNSGSSSSGAGACANPLYPVVSGASWTYSFTSAAPGNFTRSITAVNADGFTDQDVFDSGISRSGEWKCQAGALIALKPDSGAPNASAQSSSISATFKTTSMDGVTLPAAINSGDKWSQNFTQEGTQAIKGQNVATKSQVAFNCTAGGSESVTVAAGTFNAVRMDCQTVLVITITMSGVDIPSNISTNSTLWYAPGVGMVKSDNALSSGGNTTIELTAYNIP
jgi:hypothetical protein